jgi:predicted TIM-barrel fold metal-dependent hydrolase
MTPVYAFCEKNNIPVMFHVNAGYYQEEFESVLRHFPRLKVICPHFCLSTIRSDRFEYLMQNFPQLYTDVSFGYMDFLVPALLRFSKDPERYRNIILKYQDRIFFGTDMIVSGNPVKTVDWLTQVAEVYRDYLEKTEYRFFAVPDQTLRGLHLERAVLEKIYYKNFDRFFYGKK